MNPDTIHKAIMVGSVGYCLTSIILIELQAFFFGELFYILTTAVTRVSIAMLLLRIAVKVWHRNILLVTTFVTIVFNTFLFFYALFQCGPISYFWTRTTQPFGGQCIPTQRLIVVTLITSSISAAADLVCALLPVAMLWNVKIQRRTKILVAVLLGMGAAAGAAVIARMPYVNEFKDKDFLYKTANLDIWSAVEPGYVRLICSYTTKLTSAHTDLASLLDH